VRKQTTVKNSRKYLTNIRRLIQAYALARPAVRFRLHILKAKNDKGDFMYAPKSNFTIEDAVIKVIGKDCALQCEWRLLETDGFEIHAFLPRPTAVGAKIANQGAFVSIDSRPMSNSRGTIRRIVAAFKDRLRKSNLSHVALKDPFFSMNIICPPDSYDLNIEPAKDDVMFGNADIVLGAIGKLLQSHYPEGVTFEPEDVDSPTLVQEPEDPADGLAPRQNQPPILIKEDSSHEAIEEARSIPEVKQPRWRSSMYGVDEDDLQFLQENRPPVIEEEEGTRAAVVSNPWTIALMNAMTKPKRTVGNGQLLSPTKSNADGLIQPSSPMRFETPRRTPLAEPLTPQSSSQMNMSQSLLKTGFEQSIQPLSHTQDQELVSLGFSGRTSEPVHFPESSRSPSEHKLLPSVSNAVPRSESSMSAASCLDFNPVQSFPYLASYSRMRHPTSSAPSCKKKKQHASSKSLPAASAVEASNTWFGQSMRGSIPSQSALRQQRRRGRDFSLLASDLSSSSRRPAVAAADRLFEDRFVSEINTDIREPFTLNTQNQSRINGHLFSSSSTPINALSRSRQSGDHILYVAENGNGTFGHSRGQQAPYGNSPRSSLVEPHVQRRHVGEQMLFYSDNESVQSRDMADQFQAYTERERPSSEPLSTTPSSCGLQPHPQTVRDSMRMHNDNGISPSRQNIAQDFQANESRFSNRPTPKPTSAGSENASFLPNRSKDVRTAMDLFRHNKLSRSARGMEAHFKPYQNHQVASSNPPSSPSRRQAPRITPPHEKTSKRHRPGRRTTDTAERKKSYRLLLEHVPQNYRMQNVVLSVYWSVSSIVQNSCRLDMNRNSLEWGYSSEEAFDAFAELVTERKIMDWVLTLDEILYEQYERVPSADVRVLLHEAIQRGLEARKEDRAVKTIGATQIVHRVIENDVLKDIGENIAGSSRQDWIAPKKANDELSNSDMSQSVDVNVERLDDAAPVSGEVVEVEEQFDDIDDDMLMDM
jgi:DNA mismatch repair ATPase MutL